MWLRKKISNNQLVWGVSGVQGRLHSYLENPFATALWQIGHLCPQVEYFKKKYGENPRSDIMGIDGCALFVLIYIVVPGQHCHSSERHLGILIDNPFIKSLSQLFDG
jgi:hypothetical protein